MAAIGVARLGEVPAQLVAAWSQGALDRALACDAELVLARVASEALLLGAFQRADPETVALAGSTRALARRGSGGPAVSVGAGTLYIGLALARPSALVACDAARIVNRHVRPLLRALTRVGATAHYFGRDWISVAHRPAGEVTFAHDATSQRTLFEAFVAVSHPFALTERASFMGKPHGTLAAITARDIDLARLEDAIVDAYASAHRPLPLPLPLPLPSPDPPAPAPSWLATTEEAIGPIGAGPDASGAFRIGGDLLVSRDALARCEAAVA